MPTISASVLTDVVQHLTDGARLAHGHADDMWDRMNHGECDSDQSAAADQMYAHMARMADAMTALVTAAPRIAIEKASNEPAEPQRWRTP
jgi:hypothetical protein